MFNAHGCVYYRIYIQRGLRHCLSSEDGQYQSLRCGMSDGFRFPRFFMVVSHQLIGSGIAVLGSGVDPQTLRPTRRRAVWYEEMVVCDGIAFCECCESTTLYD